MIKRYIENSIIELLSHFPIVGIIGAGSFVQGTILHIMSSISDYSFIGIASSSGVNAINVANKYGFKYQ